MSSLEKKKLEFNYHVCYHDFHRRCILLDNKTIGANIRKARKEKGMTQKELAAAISRTESSVAKYEQGLVDIPNMILSSIAAVLDVEPWELMGYDGSIRVRVSPEQRECSDLLKKEADGTITDTELQRLGELLAKQPPLGETTRKLTATLERMKQCLAPLNDAGQQKLVAHTEDYARDLAKVPEYRRQEATQAFLPPPEGKDTTPAEEPTEGPPEGQE